MIDAESRALLQRYQAGDEEAAGEIFTRYVERLIALARSKMSNKLKKRIDPDDVVQSAYRSFFRIADADRVELKRSGDLWRLLAAITANKVLQQAEKHRAGKRSINHEDTLGPASLGLPPERIVHDPTASEVAALNEEVQGVMRELMPLHRDMLERRLQGASVSTISTETERTETQVRRVLKKAKEMLEERLNQWRER